MSAIVSYKIAMASTFPCGSINYKNVLYFKNFTRLLTCSFTIKLLIKPDQDSLFKMFYKMLIN